MRFDSGILQEPFFFKPLPSMCFVCILTGMFTLNDCCGGQQCLWWYHKQPRTEMMAENKGDGLAGNTLIMKMLNFFFWGVSALNGGLCHSVILKVILVFLEMKQ